VPEFEELRAQLNDARRKTSESDDAVRAIREVRRRLDAEETALERDLDPESEAYIAAKRDLDRRRRELRERGTLREREYAAAVEAELGLVGAFAELSDPRKGVERLDDGFPMLLFPVRLETRFGDVDGRAQLWVRVYPDDCSIDTFEESLSDVEVANARRFWQEWWRAGGVEDDERGAWRGLVGSHGSGRAAWIVQQYVPENADDAPEKAERTHVVLVVSTETPLNAAEAAAAATFWEEVWRAGDDGVRAAAARADLVAAVGSARADAIEADYRPFNLADAPQPPLDRDDVAVTVAFLVFPADVETKLDSWSRAPRAVALPDRFVLIGRAGGETVEVVGAPVRSPLIVGPDPSAPPEQQIRPDDGGIAVPDELRWLVDFDRAVADGLGFRVDLTETQVLRGFDRLYVLGVRLSASEEGGQAQLEELLAHHQHGRSGLELIPQGRPTNNTEQASSGFSRTDDADESFDDLFSAERLFEDTGDQRLKADGQRLAEALGIRTDALGRVQGSGGVDGVEARAMQTALWPATLGYMMGTLLDPVFDDDDVEFTRGYFTRFVTGRGPVAPVRIGRQPYGILPTTAFSRLSWLDRDDAHTRVRRTELSFLRRLRQLLGLAGTDWAAMAQRASFVGKPGDPHALLLDILGLHPASVEFHYRYAQSLEHLFNRLNLEGFGAALMNAIRVHQYQQAGLQLLRRFGYDGEEQPDILELSFFGGQDRLAGAIVDDRPLSEIEPVRDYTTDGRNYLEWLLDSARTSLEALRSQQGFADGKVPTAVLYLLLRHALMLGYHEASYMLHRAAEFPSERLLGMKHEAPFVHVQDAQVASESRFAPLYAIEPRITDSDTLTVAEYIADRADELDEARVFADQLASLELLAQTPTARLERLLAEHVDTCSYRFDAWQLGLVNLQLEAMRSRGDGEEGTHRQGVYLGAYAWLEDVRPENKVLTPVELEGELAEVFADGGPLVRDSTNGGFVLAPSLNHAVTAAVLRNGYLANASPDVPSALAVNLSSERVRLALGVLEGLRAGQSLGALLGYRLERGLHDRHAVAEVDRFVYALRKAFPLRANKISSTVPEDEGVPIDAVDARNVVDGLLLVERVRGTGNDNYPFGLDLPAANTAESAAIDSEVQRLLDLHDAVADLALAEGVHQAVQGNFDRVSATLDAYAQGQYPPEPDVVSTPTTGITLTHRIGLHLEPGLAAPAGATPRATAEPALDSWLESVLPPLGSIGCTVTWTDPVTGTDEEEVVTLADLGVRPLDLLYLLPTDAEQAMLELDDRLMRHVVDQRSPRPDAQLTIRYLRGPVGGFSIFETAPLVVSLRSLLLRARPLRPTDVRLAAEATTTEPESSTIDSTRIEQVKDDLDDAAQEAVDFLVALDPLLADPVANRAALVAGIDGFLDDAVEVLSTAGRFGVPQTGWGFALAWRRAQFAALLDELRARETRWDARLDEFDDLVGEYDGPSSPPTVDEKFELLRRSEALVSTVLAPQPLDPDNLRTTLTTKRGLFDAKLEELRDLLDTTETTVSGLLAAVAAALPLEPFDPEPFTLAAAEDRAVAFAGELAAVVRSAHTALTARSAAAQAELDAHAAAATPRARVEALDRAAKALLGEDARVIPEFTLAGVHADEWQNAYAAGDGGQLLSFLTGTAGIDLPVDEWLYGAARVREKLALWERIVMLSGALDVTEPELTPLQLPHRPGDTWIALQFPDDYVLDRDVLLYTAHYVQPFDKSRPQCGLLLDEWSEVVPATEVLETDGTTERVASHMAGLAFHYDRPSCEPPQTMLLVTPATWDGRWQWADLVGALDDTLDLAKKRTVEPVHVDATAYARFLPATVAAVTLRGLSIALALAKNNHAFDLVRGVPDG
jgi:hypothetical protein